VKKQTIELFCFKCESENIRTEMKDSVSLLYPRKYPDGSAVKVHFKMTTRICNDCESPYIDCVGMMDEARAMAKARDEKVWLKK
tara:strand:+ start:174 stop:425 length:252 start_codon:yes stop_codon:yes gene_type:complete